MFNMRWIVTTLLAISALVDLQKREVPLLLLLLAAGGGVAKNIYTGRFEMNTILLAMIPGILLLIVAFFTKEAVGYGDGLLLLALGLYLEGAEVIQVLLLALLLSAIFGMILLLCGKAGRKTALPFVPFLFLSYLGVGFL